ncbi:MAG: hypothetical protein L0214_03530 [candidate division NC10 bacterium]|nr:hypothetical protein [candidate division NC10 bacterium]
MEALMQVGGFVLMVRMTYGPVVALLGLLNLRDHRQSRLLGSVMQWFPPREFGGRLAVQVRCALLSPRSVVTLDMRACSREEIWQAVARLSRSLPPGVRVLVDGTIDPQCPAPVTLAIPGRRPLARPSHPSAVTR